MITMQLRRTHEERVELSLTDTELLILRNGLNEALQELQDWEFSTRMGVDREHARRVRDELRDAARQLEEGPRSDS